MALSSFDETLGFGLFQSSHYCDYQGDFEGDSEHELLVAPCWLRLWHQTKLHCYIGFRICGEVGLNSGTPA